MRKFIKLQIIALVTVFLFAPFFSGVLAQETSLTNKEFSVLLNQPSVTQIYAQSCGNIVLKTGEESVRVCSTQLGSGFFISNDGVLVTQSSVLTPSSEEFIFNAINNENILYFYINNLYETEPGVILSKSEVETLAEQILADDEMKANVFDELDLAHQNGVFTINNGEVEIYIKRNGVNFEITEDYKLASSTEHYSGTIINIGNEIISSEDDLDLGSVVLIRVAVSNMPAVSLGELDDVIIGSPILTFGYGRRINSEIDLGIQMTGPKLLSGIISSSTVVGSAQSRVLVSDINTDNFFGEIGIERDGKVVGVSTSVVFSDTKAVLYLIDIGDVKTLANNSQIQIGQGEIDILWQNGLDHFRNNRYSDALKIFTKVKGLFAEHALVDQYLSLAQERYDAEGGETGLISLVHRYLSPDITEQQLPVVIGVFFAILVVVIFIIYRLFRIVVKPREKKLPEMPVYPTSASVQFDTRVSPKVEKKEPVLAQPKEPLVVAPVPEIKPEVVQPAPIVEPSKPLIPGAQGAVKEKRPLKEKDSPPEAEIVYPQTYEKAKPVEVPSSLQSPYLPKDAPVGTGEVRKEKREGRAKDLIYNV